MLLCCAIEGGWQSQLTARKVAACRWLPVRLTLCQPLCVADSESSFYHKDLFFVKSVGETLPEMITENCLVQIVSVKFLIYL